MQQHFTILLFFIAITSYSQGLEKFKDIIDIDSDFTTIESNIDELNAIDLSNFWIDNKTERRLGFIGSNYRRLSIKFLSLIKNADKVNEYFVYGKSKVSDNICKFQGLIQITESYYVKSDDYPGGNTGIFAGEYTFYEDPNNYHSGIFSGRFITYWYKDKAGKIKYNDLWDVSAMYNNNQFVGTWKEYGKANVMTANWGDGRIPQSGDLDAGSSEFAVNDKYQKNGWDSFVKASAGGYSDAETEKARKQEAEVWWEDK